MGLKESFRNFKRKKVYTVGKEVFYMTLGAVIFAAGFNIFIEPAGIILGGVTGIATIINYFTKDILPFLTIGLLIILLNIPLFLFSFKVLGKKFIIRAGIGTLVSSIAIDLFGLLTKYLRENQGWFNYSPDNALLYALLGGGCVGGGLALMYAHGYTTGGTDLLMFVLKHWFKKFSAGKITMVLDGIVILSSLLVYRSGMVIIYSLITAFVETRVMDYVMSGFDRGRLAFIFSDKGAEIADKICTVLDRGVTAFDATGWYTGNEKKALICAIRPGEVYQLKEIVTMVDPAAFVVFADASDIQGSGFEKIQD